MKQGTPTMLLIFAGVALAASLASGNAWAEVDNLDLMDGVLVRFQATITPMGATIVTAASRLFWALAIISMIWTFGQMVTRNADIGEFFGEFLRFTFFTGLFWWLLVNGPNMAVSLMNSMRQLGGEASGLNTAVSPSNIVDVGFAIFDRVVDKSSIWSPAYTTVGVMIAGVILVVLALIAMNMLILLISGWILAYAGAFFLGFGGARWTSEMAISYFKTVLNVSAQLLAMVVIVGLGNAILSDYYARLSEKASLKELAVELVVAVVLLGLVNKIPPLIGNLASGGGTHGMGGGYGAGSAARGAMGLQASVHTAGQALGTAGAVTGAGIAGALGGGAALIAAIKEGQANTAAGTDIASTVGASLASLGGGTPDYRSGAGSSARSGTGRSLAEQMGMGIQGAAPAFAASGSAPAGGQSRQGAGLGAGGASGGAGAEPGGSGKKDAKGSGGSSTGNQGPANGQSPGMAGLVRDGAGAVVGSTGGGQQGVGRTAGGGVLGTVATGGRIAADAAANLGAGVYDFGMEQAGEAIAKAQARMGKAIDQTWGGQVAERIRARGARGRGEAGPDESDVFGDDSLSAAASRDTTVDAAAEIAAFRDRGTAS